MKDGLIGIRTFVIPSYVLADTIHFLRAVGKKGCEGFVLWGGKTFGTDGFRFESAVVPAQRASIGEDGLLVTVDGEALFEVNRALYQRGETLGAQVHSHPTEAYHSSTDDQFPLATLLGSLSVVVPDFARRAPHDIDQWAWYRLAGCDHWEHVTDDTTIEIE